jgi:hypothetical protein
VTAFHACIASYPMVTNQLSGVLLLFPDRSQEQARTTSDNPTPLITQGLRARRTDPEAHSSKPCSEGPPAPAGEA